MFQSQTIRHFHLFSITMFSRFFNSLLNFTLKNANIKYFVKELDVSLMRINELRLKRPIVKISYQVLKESN